MPVGLFVALSVKLEMLALGPGELSSVRARAPRGSWDYISTLLPHRAVALDWTADVPNLHVLVHSPGWGLEAERREAVTSEGAKTGQRRRGLRT